MSTDNTEFEDNSGEEMVTNMETTNKDSQQALKQLNQLAATNIGTTTVTKTITTTTLPKEQKLSIAGGTKIVYVST